MDVLLQLSLTNPRKARGGADLIFYFWKRLGCKLENNFKLKHCAAEMFDNGEEEDKDNVESQITQIGRQAKVENLKP